MDPDGCVLAVCVDSAASRSEPRPEGRGREDSSGQGEGARTQRGGGHPAVSRSVGRDEVISVKICN